MDEERTAADAGTEPAHNVAFKRLPPRITPEQMVETQAVDRPDPTVYSGTEAESQIRTSGAG